LVEVLKLEAFAKFKGEFIKQVKNKEIFAGNERGQESLFGRKG
jgi:hypothetical protein